MRRLEDIGVPEYWDLPATRRQRAILVSRLQSLCQLSVQLTEVGPAVVTNDGMWATARATPVVFFKGRESMPSIGSRRLSWPFYGMSNANGVPWLDEGDAEDWYMHIRYFDAAVPVYDPRLPNLLIALCFSRKDVTCLIRDVGKCIKEAEATLSEIALLALKETA